AAILAGLAVQQAPGALLSLSPSSVKVPDMSPMPSFCVDADDLNSDPKASSAEPVSQPYNPKFKLVDTYYGKQYGSHLKINIELYDPAVCLLGIPHKKYNPYFVKIWTLFVLCGVSHNDAVAMETNQMTGDE
ncbi:hypothetical protein STEG23_037690, partial [Scotinomys teguina]